MTRHLTIEELQGFQRDTANPQQLLRVDRHLADCPECQRKLRSVAAMPTVPELLQRDTTDAPLHPAYEQLVAYLDGGQNAIERETMNDHISACRSCKAELDDLRGFDARMLLEQEAAHVAAQPKPSWMARYASEIRGWFVAPGNARLALSSLALLIVGVAVIANVQLSHPEQLAGHIRIDDVTHVASDGHVQFYAGLIASALGIAGIVYKLRK